MATFDEIRVNRTWFRQQIQEIDQRSRLCQELSAKAACMTLEEGAWPENVQSFKDSYTTLVTAIATSATIGYATGSSRLRAISVGLVETGKSYLRAEADNETEIRTQIIDLLETF